MDRTAEPAGVNKRLIYDYFENKESLFLAALERGYEGIRGEEQQLNPTQVEPVEAIRRLIAFTWTYCIAHPEFLTLLNSENLHRARHLKQSTKISAMHFRRWCRRWPACWSAATRAVMYSDRLVFDAQATAVRFDAAHRAAPVVQYARTLKICLRTTPQPVLLKVQERGQLDGSAAAPSAGQARGAMTGPGSKRPRANSTPRPRPCAGAWRPKPPATRASRTSCAPMRPSTTGATPA